MAAAVSEAVKGLTHIQSIPSPLAPIIKANMLSWGTVKAPDGNGRFWVLFMTRSAWRSAIWFSTAAEQDARAIPSSAVRARPIGGFKGVAKHMPTKVVKSISATTLGLHAAK